MTGVKSYLSHAIAKPLVAGLAAGAADHFLMKNQDIKSNMYFAAAVGGGIAAVSWVEPLVSPCFPSHTPCGMIGKALEGRIIEIVCGSGAAYAMNRYVLKNEYTSEDMMYKLAIVIGADLIAETVCEVLCII